VEHRHHGQDDVGLAAPSESAVIAPNVCRNVLRWLYTTPLGLPVVPLV
jgi:hypothetical protein